MSPNKLIIQKQPYGVELVKINRPEALNALNAEVIAELTHYFTELKDRPKEVRVVVLTGEGEKAFVAGADIKAMQNLGPVEGKKFGDSGHALTKLMEECPQPIIAAVNGFALGGGTELAIACDFILASDKAVFGQPEVGLGIIPGFGGTVRLAHFVGWPRAKELIFSGRNVKAEEAKQIGLANHVFPPGELIKEALALATKISRHSFSAVSAAKSLTNQFSGKPLGRVNQLDTEAQKFGELFESHDQKEGMGAFVEKRKPQFEGINEERA